MKKILLIISFITLTCHAQFRQAYNIYTRPVNIPWYSGINTTTSSSGSYKIQDYVPTFSQPQYVQPTYQAPIYTTDPIYYPLYPTYFMPTQNFNYMNIIELEFYRALIHEIYGE